MDMMGNGMDVGKDLMKNHYLKKGKFCSNLNIEDITVKNCQHAKRVWGKGIGGEFGIKDLCKYHDLYV